MTEEQTPVTPEESRVDNKTARAVGIFLGGIAAYCIVGLSLGKFVPEFSDMGKQLVNTGIGFLTGLVAPVLANAILKK